MQRGRFNTGPDEHYLSDGFDPHHAFVSLLPRFVDLARSAARKKAVSYRNFHVGATMYAGDSTFTRVATLEGANSKPSAEHPKHCAEMDVIDQAEALGLSSVLGMVIAGTSDAAKIKEVTGIASPTLHPCSECRARMADSGLFTDSSLVVTISTDEDLYEVHTYEEMARFWQSPSESGQLNPTVRYDVEQWPWRQVAYGRNLFEVPDSRPWEVAKFALSIPVVPVPEIA